MTDKTKNQTTQRRVSYDPRFFDNLLDRQIQRERQVVVSGKPIDTKRFAREMLRLNHSRWRSFLRRLSLRFLSRLQ